MHLKDYYTILELTPAASITDIKKAYRKLALRHHPDTNNNDALSAALFAEIKEAYEVLTDPAKKEYYLQQRWYDQSMGKRKTQDLITPVNVLKQALELEKYVSKLDVFRMDKQGLKEYTLGLLPDTTIAHLHIFKEQETNRQICYILLRAIKPLPLVYTGDIITQLEKLAVNDTIAQTAINDFVQLHQIKNRREKYTLLAIIIITLLTCLLIFWVGR